MKLLNIICAACLICLSGCAETDSGAPEITANAARAAVGVIDVNASEGAGDTASQASCETKYNEKSEGRAHNIKLAAEKLNGVTIEPGEEFSYNKAVGPTGKSNGYKKARIFIRGQDAEGFGGGVCQVSSALYNCALDLGLEIVERHPHSKPVGYVPKNRDAATSYGGKDLRFKNSLDFPLKITTSAKDGVLNVAIGR